MNAKIRKILIAGAALVFSGPIYSQRTQPASIPSPAPTERASDLGMRNPVPEMDSFSKLDKNADGVIDKQEAASDAALAKQFDALDTNRDGRVDHAEFYKFDRDSSTANR